MRAADLAMYQDKLVRKGAPEPQAGEPREWTPPPHVPES
jgi:hypothetical protein